MKIMNCTAKPIEVQHDTVDILQPGESVEPIFVPFRDVNIRSEEGSVVISNDYGRSYKTFGQLSARESRDIIVIEYATPNVDLDSLLNKKMFTTLTANEDLYVRVKDINECLKDDSWNKDDEIHDYAVGLIDWCINKRAVDFETLCKMEGYTVPEKIGENKER